MYCEWQLWSSLKVVRPKVIAYSYHVNRRIGKRLYSWVVYDLIGKISLELEDDETRLCTDRLAAKLEVMFDITNMGTITICCLLNDGVSVELESIDETALHGSCRTFYRVLPESMQVVRFREPSVILGGLLSGNLSANPFTVGTWVGWMSHCVQHRIGLSPNFHTIRIVGVLVKNKKEVH